MYCKLCGAQLPEGAGFCQSCGKAVELESNGSIPNCKDVAKSAKTSIGPKLVVVVVLASAVLAWLLFGGRGYKATLKQYVDATMDGNAKKIVSLMPKDYVRASIRSGEYDSKADIVDDIDEILDYTVELYEECFGKRMKYDYNIVNVYKYTADEMEQYFYYYDYGNISGKVDAVMEVTYSLELSGNDQSSSTSETVVMYKIGRNWYIIF